VATAENVANAVTNRRDLLLIATPLHHPDSGSLLSFSTRPKSGK
jgi:hypothetical protein